MRILSILLLALLEVPSTLSQVASTPAEAYRIKLSQTVDSLIRDERKYLETVLSHGDAYFRQSSWNLRAHADSLLAAARYSLDVDRMNSIQLLGLDMERSMHSVGEPAQTNLRLLLAQCEKQLHTLFEQNRSCPTCATEEDFETADSLFQLKAESISGLYGDSMATVVEGWETSIDDTTGSLKESVNDSLQTLKEDYASYLLDHASHLEIEAVYASQSSSRGRDNGISLASYNATATYQHNTGLFVAGSAGWTSQSDLNPDMGSLSAGYAFTISPMLAGSASYTHFWYSAGSPRPAAVTDQEVSGMLALSTTVLNAAGTLLDDYTAGGGSEMTIELALSKDIDISEQAFGGTLKVSPTATATWGQQTERILQKRVKRTQKKEIVRTTGTPYDVFGIMDYELSLPLELMVGNFIVEPAIDWIMPVDVLNQKTVLVKDPSSSSPFLSAGLTVSMIFR